MVTTQYLNNENIDSKVIGILPDEYIPYIKFILNELIDRKLNDINVLYRTEGTNFDEVGICSLILPDLNIEREEVLEEPSFTGNNYRDSPSDWDM